MINNRIKSAEDLTHADLGEIQSAYLRYFDRGIQNRMDRCDAAAYNARIWYAAVTEYLEHQFNKPSKKDKNSDSAVG